MKANFSLLTLGFFLAAGAAIAEGPTAHVAPSDTPTEKAEPRPEGKWDIVKYETTISGLFHWPVNDVKAKFETTLTPALENVVKSGDESAIAPILAELFGTVDNAQRKLIKDVAETELEKLEKHGDDKNTDNEAVAFLKRLDWASTGLLLKQKAIGEDELKDKKGGEILKQDDGQKFLTAFFGDGSKTGAMTERDILNGKLVDAFKAAVDPNTTDASRQKNREFVLENVTRTAAMAWVEGQTATGNSEAARAFLNSIKDPNGNIFFKNDPQPLNIGPSQASMDDALAKYADSHGGHISGAVLARDQSEVPTALVDALPPPKTKANFALQTKPTGSTGTTGQTTNTQPRQDSRIRANPTSSVQGGLDAAKAAFVANCQGCHSLGHARGDGDKAKAIGEVTSGKMPDAEMLKSKFPNRPPFDAKQKALVLAYLNSL